MGHQSYVFTHRQFESEVLHAGGHFVDLFSKYPIDIADDSSIPFASRYVSFAGKYLEEILNDVKAYEPSLIVYDTFAVIGRIVGALLDLPHINVCAGHNRIGSTAVQQRRQSPVAISKACNGAVKKLRDLGLEDVTPYYYLCATSPYLNIYCEPPEFLQVSERHSFEPIAFFGSVQPNNLTLKAPTGRFRSKSGKKLRLYISFGTVVWFYDAVRAIAALRTLSQILEQLRWAETIITLGGWPVAQRLLSGLRRPNVRVERYIDQWNVLKEADLFITHHGLNSTHEAIFHGVPMISYPFIADQPALARRCQDMGLAVRLTNATLDCIQPGNVLAAIDRICQDRQVFDLKLAEARIWELDVISTRAEVLQKVVNLTKVSAPSSQGQVNSTVRSERNSFGIPAVRAAQSSVSLSESGRSN